MKQYKYSLDKSSKKFICPDCNKKTFVLYIETQTGNYLSDVFGRCDRESNCSYHNAPNGEFQNKVEIKYTAPPEPSFHNYDLVSQSARNYKQNNFIQFLTTLFSIDEVKQAILKYLIGTSKHWNGATVFWQIDNLHRVHAGKILRYTSENGKRVKNNQGKSLINWVHSVMKTENFNLNQCLFGLHLINETNKKTIAIVEAEKTAVIMSLFKPQYTWLATGSKSGFKYDLLKPVKDFYIIGFPDKSEFEDWNNKAIELNKVGFKISVNDWLEKTDYPKGSDFADVFISEKKCIYNSKEETFIHYTNTEQVIHKLEQRTPEIRLLIETFDLTDYDGKKIRKVN